MRDAPPKPIFGFESPRLDPPNPPQVKVWRSIAKAASWRTFGTIDTLILSFLLITYLGPVFGLEPSQGEAIEAASLIAVTEVVTKITLYFVHERAWAAIKWGVTAAKRRRVESLARTSVKTASWRIIASIDTVVLALIYTGSIQTAISIGGLEIFTKLILYFVHERIWTRLPFGIDHAPETAEPATGTS